MHNPVVDIKIKIIDCRNVFNVLYVKQLQVCDAVLLTRKLEMQNKEETIVGLVRKIFLDQVSQSCQHDPLQPTSSTLLPEAVSECD